jgi:16S rRNA (cytosine1407-C5)-methyltransferase
MSKKKKRPIVGATGNLIEDTMMRYQPLLDPENYQKLQEELLKPLSPTMRINLLKHDPAVISERLQQLYDWKLTPIAYCPSGFRVDPGETSLSTSIEHRMGDFYIQEAASMLPAELFDIVPDQHPLVLDMAASPGGKTIHLADRINDQGLIIANDSSHARLTALQIVLQKWGVINQAVTCMPGELFGDLYPEVFDLVLLDAPCSMEGLRTTSSHPMRAISDKERQRLAQRQQKMLESALRAARVGGQIVYSTCTLAPEEDESVLAAVLKQFPDVFEIDNMQSRLPFQAQGLNSNGQTQYPEEVSHSIRLWPHVCHTAGFFAARLTKKKQIHSQNVSGTHRSKPNEVSRIPERDMKLLCKILISEYGFDLEKLTDQLDLSVSIKKDELILFPNKVLKYFDDLFAVSQGLRFGSLNGPEFYPSHEFSARFGYQFQTGKMYIPDELLPNWLRGEDLRGFTTLEYPKGKVVIVIDQYGRNLGRGKVQSAQLKNLLPNRLFQ